MNPPPTLPPPGERTGPPPARAGRRSLAGWLGDAARMFVVGFPLYGVLAVLFTLGCALAAPFVPGGRRKYVVQRAIHRGMALWAAVMERIGVLEIHFHDLPALRALRGAVIAPNHPGLLDATLFIARLPQLTCLMKGSILSNPFMGGLARLAGHLRNDHGPEFIRQGRDALRAGENLLIFPEGTRTVAAPVNAFKMGFALIATLADAPVQTVFIEMPVFYLGKRWRLWWFPRLPVQITVRAGRQFRAQPGQTAKAFGDELEGYFRANLEPGAADGVQRKADPDAAAGVTLP